MGRVLFHRGRLGMMALLTAAMWGCPNPHVPYTPSPPSDGSLALDSTDPLDAAKAIGMNDGLLSAQWIDVDGSAFVSLPGTFHTGHGIHAGFGATGVREGSRLLELSTGAARLPSEPGYIARLSGYDKGYASVLPVGFPHNDIGHPASTSGFDGIGLEVVMKVPTGVSGFMIDFRYYTTDFSDFMQSAYIDQAAGLMTSSSSRATGLSFMLDQSANPLYSSASLLSYGVGLPGGDADLLNSGYYHLGALSDQGAASAWLTASVVRGVSTFADGDTLTFLFGIWDSGDHLLDSSLLLDNFRWIPE